MMLFEFILVVIDPAADAFTKGVHVFQDWNKLCSCGTIFTLHSFFEEKLKKLFDFKKKERNI